MERALEELDAFAAGSGAPLYVVWRPADHDGTPAAASVMGRRPDRFRAAFVNDAATVFERRGPAVPGAGAPTAP